jgi:hypothetical protein
MRVISATSLGISSLLLAAALPAQVSPGSSLVGTWEAVARSAGGLGTTVSFGVDNSLSYTVGAMVDFKYRRVRDSLFIVDPEGNSTASRIRIAHDTLITFRGDSEQRETRLGAVSAGDSLVGIWTYPHYTGVAAYEEYTPAGDLRLRIPIRTLRGTYATQGDSAVLHLAGPGGGDRAVHFAVVADTLLLVWNGQTNRYLKAKQLGR